MSDGDDQGILWHTGLFARLDTAFPKKCPNCGRVFENADQYFTETVDVNGRDRGLKSYMDDGTTTIVEAFRNCPCGSTLMETFDDHREELHAQLARENARDDAAGAECAHESPHDDRSPGASGVTRGPTEPVTLGQPIDDELGFEFTEMFAEEPGSWNDAWYEGLRPSGDDAFPKHCPSCGRVYETPEDFFQETAAIATDETGLRQVIDETEGVFVEAFRNCLCGSTLMDNFSDRRDMSAAGKARRRTFSEHLEFLVEKGIDAETAREELLKVIRGGKSSLLSGIRPPGAKA